MVEINLLAWRESAREHQRRQFRLIIWLSVTGLLMVLASCHWLLINKIQQIKKHSYDWQQQLSSLMVQTNVIKKNNQRRVQRENVLALSSRIESSQQDTLQIFEKILTILPAEMSLSDMQRQGQIIILKGHSHSTIALTRFVNELGAGAQLRETQQADSPYFNFQIQVTQQNPAIIDQVKHET